MNSASWTSDEFTRIGQADELALTARRADGSVRAPVTIWVVASNDELYVRSWRGHQGGWFAPSGPIPREVSALGGIDRDVAFIEAARAAPNRCTARAPMTCQFELVVFALASDYNLCRSRPAAGHHAAVKTL